MGLVSALIAIAVVATITSAVFGVIQAFSPPVPGKIDFGSGGSPQYNTFGPLNNNISNEIAIPVLYGQLKLAGNFIWQSDPASTVNKVMSLCEGQIQSITDIRANDIVIDDTDTPGSSVTAYLGTNSQESDPRLPDSLRPDMALKRLAYVAMTLADSSSLHGGNPTITCVAQGTLIETWSSGAWQTVKQYSRNPVACIRDFLLSTRYGMGIGKAILDDTTFGAAADYCDELVDTPSGVKESRYQLDFILDTQKPAQDFLNEMLATFNGFLVYSGNKIKLRIEKLETITQYFGDGSTTKQNASFDPSNIVRDSFGWNMASMDDRPNRMKVQWVDPSQNYVKVYTQVDDWIDQDTRGVVMIKEVALLGITRQTQASRMAKYMMASAKYAAVTVSFSARLDSIHCEVGDVIALTHQAAKFTRRLMRIVQMQEAEDETIQITCKDYIPSLFDDRLGAAVITYTQPSGPNLYAPLSDVTGLTLLEEDFVQKDGVFVTNITTNWSAIPADQLLRLDRYIIQLSSDGGVTYRDVAFASSQKTSYRIVLGNVQTGTTFLVRIKTLSDRGAESSGTSASITITGKSTAPSDVSDFNVVFAFDHIAMTWSAINDADLFAYEIRQGDASSVWETAAIVATELLTSRFDLLNFTRGTKKFFVKAIDNSGNYSVNAATSSIVITSIPDSNVVFTFDLWSRISQVPQPLEGTLSSLLERVPTPDYDPTYNRLTLQPKPTNTWASLQAGFATWAAFQASGFVWGMEQYTTVAQSYITTPIDLGVVIQGAYILDTRSFSNSNLGFVSFDIATSSDGVTFSAFTPFVAGQYNTRYIKLRINIQATDPGTVVRSVGAILTVDVPDRDQSFLNQAIGSGGSTIGLTGFTQVKSIVITVVGSTPLSPRITNQANLPTSFDMVLDNIPPPGTSSGNVNIYVKGY